MGKGKARALAASESAAENDDGEEQRHDDGRARRKSRVLVQVQAQAQAQADSVETQENDDEAERAALIAEDRGAQARVGAQFGSPRPSGHPRRSMCTAQSIDSPQKEHFQGCLKLFAENKINKDNAWNLRLIDFMTAMLKKHDSRMENLQIASTTLDASAKIYSFRVDAIHHDVLKMAGGLSKATQNRRGKRAEDETGENEPAEEDSEENRQKKKDKRKKVAKSSLSSNPRSQLNAEIEINECIDPFFARLAATAGDMTSSNRAFNATLPIEDETLALILRSDVNFLNSVRPEAGRPAENRERFDLKSGSFLRVTEDDHICMPFHGFSILNWDPDNEEAQIKTNTQKWIDNNLNLSQQAMAFDMNADVEPLPQNDVDGFELDHDDNNFGVESDEEEAGIVPDALKREKLKTITHLVDMRPVSLGDGYLEYSYSTAVIGAWAGPSHWKLKNNVNKGSKLVERQSNVTTVVVKKAISRKKKQLDLLSEGIEFNINYKSCPQYNVAPSKTIIGRKTLSHGTAWSKNFETPIDRGFNLLYLRKLNCKESAIVRPISEIMLQIEKEKDFVHRISDINNYDYNNDLDNSYCPNSQPADDDAAWQNDDDVLAADVHNQQGFVDANNEMVEPPAKVAKIFIPYAMRAKKVDMKQLKHATWKILAVADDNKENETDNCESKSENVKDTSFKMLFKQLPVKLSTNMKECLSVSLSLLAVLHLANEKSLYLNNDVEHNDFTISKENKNIV